MELHNQATALSEFVAVIVRSVLSWASRQIVSTSERADEITLGVTPILDEVPGLVMLTQTCDIVRDCRQRPFVEMAPLVQVTADELENIRRLRKPAFAFVPGAAAGQLVADLDRTMTVEKALVADWRHISGWKTDNELRDFVLALTRKRARFAFPDDFVTAVQPFQARLAEKHDRKSDEGSHVRALREIRVRAAPSWDSERVQLSWWFIKDADPEDAKVDWPAWADKWIKLFQQTKRFLVEPLQSAA
jgi:hypothetical protein